MEEGRDEDVGNDCEGGPIIDFGLVSLVPVVGRVRVVLRGSGPSPAGICVEGFRVAVVFDRLSPNIPDLGLLRVPIADADGAAAALLPGTESPAPGRAIDVGTPGFGNRLGDGFREDSVTDVADEEGSAALFLGSRAFFVSSFLEKLLRPAVGCRRERVRFSPVADDEDDILSCRSWRCPPRGCRSNKLPMVARFGVGFKIEKWFARQERGAATTRRRPGPWTWGREQDEPWRDRRRDQGPMKPRGSTTCLESVAVSCLKISDCLGTNFEHAEYFHVSYLQLDIFLF